MADQETSTVERIVAVVIAVVMLVITAGLLSEFTHLSDKTITGMGTYSGFGLCVLAWRWPRTFTTPIRWVIGRK